MRRRIRWAIVIALLGVIIAIAIGAAALYTRDEAPVAVAGPVEGNYAFATTTLLPAVTTASSTASEVVIAGGRLSIGGDGHVFWSLQMHSTKDASKTGRLTCEGSFDRTARAIDVAPRYGYSDFAPDMATPEMQLLLYSLMCSGASTAEPNVRLVDVVMEGLLLQLKGRAGVINWRRE